MTLHSSHGSLSSLWSSQSESYAQFRPTYNAEFLNSILELAALQRMELALDVGCGSGQVSFDLAQRFDKVFGIDASAEQLRHARPSGNITYLERAAEETGLREQSVDLISAATCLHWFNVPAFYKEARRVLHPQGALAMWGYFPTSLRFLDCKKADDIVQGYCQEMREYFHPVLHHCMKTGYEGLEPSAEEFEEVQAFRTAMQLDMSIDHVVGCLRSWSCNGRFAAKHGQQALEEKLSELGEGLREAFAEAVQLQGSGGTVKGTLQLSVILAKGPKPL